LHTYDIAGAASEAKEPGIQNKIYYTQAYHIEKEAFSASKSILLEELNENDAIYNSSKINKTCKNSIIILNKIINTHFGARLEYRIGFDITNQFYNIVQDKLHNYLTINPFYIISTHLISKVKIAKLKTFLNIYNLSFSHLLQSANFNNESFRICLVILIKIINQSFEALSNTKKYFDNYTARITSQQNQQLTNFNDEIKINSDDNRRIKRLINYIITTSNHEDEMHELVELIWA
ncbi:11258_t:CDS:2, partial [Scutellospora calospora]